MVTLPKRSSPSYDYEYDSVMFTSFDVAFGGAGWLNCLCKMLLRLLDGSAMVVLLKSPAVTPFPGSLRVAFSGSVGERSGGGRR